MCCLLEIVVVIKLDINYVLFAVYIISQVEHMHAEQTVVSKYNQWYEYVWYTGNDNT